MKVCPYESCRVCGGCAVCGDFHGDVYGGCTDLSCPRRWWHKIRDWLRRLVVGKVEPPWRVE